MERFGRECVRCRFWVHSWICDQVGDGFFSNKDVDVALGETQQKIQIRTNASPRHVPSKIINVSDIPRTKNGKIVELAVKNIIEGNEIKNKEALANPETLNEFKNLTELQY